MDELEARSGGDRVRGRSLARLRQASGERLLTLVKGAGEAIRDVVAECGTVKQGDWMAITADGIQAALPTTRGALIALVDGLVQEESELVTVLVGSDAAWSDVNALRDHLDTKHPHVEVEVHDGGQPLYPFLVGVE